MTFNFLGWKGCADCSNNDDDDEDVNDNDNNNDFISAFPQKVKWLFIRK